MRHTIGILLTILALATLTAGCATDAEIRAKSKKEGDYHYQLGRNYFGEKLIPQALRELLLAVEHDPENPDAYHMLGFIYMGRRDYRRAIEYYKKAIALREDFYIAVNNLGTAYLADERWDEAIELYEDLIGKPMYNSPELAYNNLGWAFYNVKAYKRAADAFEMAAFLQPKMCLAHHNLGLTRLKQANKVGAAKEFGKAIEKCPSFVDPHFELAQILREQGDPKARSYYKRCYELAGDTNTGERCRSYLEVFQ